MDGRESFLELMRAKFERRKQRLEEAGAAAWSRWSDAPGEHVLPAAAVAAGTLLVSLILAIQMWVGSLELPLFLVISLSGMLLGLILLTRSLLGSDGPHHPFRLSGFGFGSASSLPLLLIASGVFSFSGRASLWPLAAALLSTFLVATWDHSGWREWPTRFRSAIRQFTLPLPLPEESLSVTTVLDARPTGHPRLAADTAHDLHPIQWMQRSMDSKGTERLKGITQVHFASGQSIVTAHIPFYPPFAQTPIFHGQPVDAPEVRIRSSIAYAYGARIELKRQGSTHGTLCIELEFVAQSAPQSNRAA